MNTIRFDRVSDVSRLPVKGTAQSAAFDLYAAETVEILPWSRSLVSTGLKLAECPNDVYLRIAPRSGLAVRGFDIGAGVVDSDYRGSVKILFINNTCNFYTVKPGDRIAQMIPERIRNDLHCEITGQEHGQQECLRETRGEGGFGSTN